MTDPGSPQPGTAPGAAALEPLLALFNQRQYAQAEPLARRITEQYPGYAFGWKALGATVQQQGEPARALPFIQQAVALAPEDPEAHSNLGNALKDLGRLDEAQASYRQAIHLQPGFAQAHTNLGVVLRALGRLDEALACHQAAVRLQPDFALAHNNLGNVLLRLERFDEAVQGFQQAVALAPGFAEAHSNLGCALMDQGLLDEALHSHQQALALQPGFVDAFSNLLFALNYHPDLPGQQIFAAYQAFEARFGRPLAPNAPHEPRPRTDELAAEPAPARRLKVGYVSPDFKRHSSQHFLEPLLVHHDPAAVELFAYAELAAEDDTTRRYRSHVDHWVPTVGLSDEALAARVRADGIDVLVDLAGHTAGNRLGVFARRPAPVSVSYLGYGYTTGLSAIDHFLTDDISAPAGSDSLFAERPWRLPGSAWVYRPADGMGEPGPLPALQRGSITFGTLTRAIRINHRTVRVWAEVLKQVPGSRLVVDSRNYQTEPMRARLRRQFAAHGIGPERLAIGYHSPPWDTLRGIDIALDCFPHNSGTTLFECLYMGVPFVTLAGRPSVGRLGSAILHAVGHAQWVADDEAAYIAKAVALASDVPALAAVRAGLRARLQGSVLMDEAGFARRVEAAYWQMWAQRG